MSSIPAVIAISYALVSVVWIVLSDGILTGLARNYEHYKLLQTYKGSFFVIGSALLIFAMLRVAMIRIRRAYTSLEENEHRLKMAFDGASGGAWEVESGAGGMKLSFVKANFLDTYGLPLESDDAMGVWKARLHPDDRDAVLEQLLRCLDRKQSEPFHALYRFYVTDTSFRWLEAWGNVVPDRRDGVRRMVGVVLDTTRQVVAEQKLDQLMRYDALTGLSRPQTFAADLDDVLGHLEEGYSLAVFHLHYVGDGVLAGDDEVETAILPAIAERLRGLTGRGCLLTRLAHRDFAVSTPPLKSHRAAQDWLNVVLDRVALPVQCPSGELPVTFVVGASACPQDGTGSTTLLRNASHALALATLAGGGETRAQWFTEGVDAQYHRRAGLIHDMRGAIDAGEIVCFFQPLVDHRRGVTAGFEALARWQRPDGTLVMPGEFIPLAEQFGLIRLVGEGILRQACNAAVSWSDGDDDEPFVAVNVSPVQLSAPAFPSLVARILNETGLKPSRLELEVTESVLTADSNAVAQRLRELRRLGVSIAIDDFGTGYSSLSLLGRLPFTRLKIDRSFISECTGTIESGAIVDTIIALSRQLGLAITAEGVETADQLFWLAGRGVDVAQGYYFSRPVPRSIADTLVGRNWFDEDGDISACDMPV